ncbi:MBOAT, membrane-bound O-acyltransferase family-domain-containing protein [Pyronema omphalodes]|nr:MBOAT, membrane-bound O-acyltransferase family-domain-containing protein [Pyronema omphalodes]
MESSSSSSTTAVAVPGVDSAIMRSTLIMTAPASASTMTTTKLSDTPAGAETTTQNGTTYTTPTGQGGTDKYKHIFAIHAKARPSTLSHDSIATPSFIGFRNLMVLVLIVGNLRLVIENFMKYGVLIQLSGAEFRKDDVQMGLLLYCLIPVHLFIGYIIELVASMHARSAQAHNKKHDNKDPKLRAAWKWIAFAHAVNATLSLSVASGIVYFKIHHPLIGSLCQFHAAITWLKQLSYAFTCRDLRDAFLEGTPTPEIYRSCAYPKNITLSNLCYFWWAPTLVYQPVYPRSPEFRWNFFLKRVGETIGLSIAIWFLTVQYAAPVLTNSLAALGSMNLPIILERLMKLSTVSLVIWLCGFFALFQSFLNALAELLRFGDREFYTDWWNSISVGRYWRTWNKPVNSFMRRHIYTPLLARGWSQASASLVVFTFSAVMHELLVGVPTHNIIGVAFAGMMFQVPLYFWISFCLVGQPLCIMSYFLSWHIKFGSMGKGMGGGLQQGNQPA